MTTGRDEKDRPRGHSRPAIAEKSSDAVVRDLHRVARCVCVLHLLSLQGVSRIPCEGYLQLGSQQVVQALAKSSTIA